jgi:class 3 adenylate cyclase/tetratricopeptide (TPR) repeat protein
VGIATAASFGSLVRRYRREAELTQEALAERAGLSVRVIRTIESGSQHRPRQDTVQLLQEALAVPADEQAAFWAAASQVQTVPTAPAKPHAVPAPSPAQLLTVLIADLRGYTAYAVQHGDEAAAELADRFGLVTRAVVEEHGGSVVELRGDEALCAFDSARQALRAALALQEQSQHDGADGGLPLGVGIGLDAGEIVPVQGGYRGRALNLAARLCALAGGGEVLISESVCHLAGAMEGIVSVDRGSVALKGLPEPVPVIQISREGELPVALQPLPSVPRPHPTNLPADALKHDAEDRAAFEETAAGGRPPVQLQPEQVGSGRAHSPRLPGGFLGARPAGPLVGREAEHARLVALLDAAAQGIGRLVTISGEPGAGKTRLAQELTLDLEARGFLVATGRCFEQRERIPYAPFLDALPALYAAAPAQVRRQAAEQWPYLAPLLPDELPPIQGASTDAQGDQLRVFRALTRFLLALAAERPVALLFDDLQWADGPSLDLLRHLAANTREAPVLLGGIHRPVSRRHPLQSTLRDLGHDGLLEQITVRRLDRARTAALLAVRLAEAEVSAQLVELIHTRTEGNPFFTMEIVRTLTERGDIILEDDTWELRAGSAIAVPESVRLAIDERVGRLPERVQTLLGQASVLGHVFTADELATMSEREGEEIDGALEAAAQAELVQERDGQAYAFSHVLVQQALYAELTGSRRRRLHLAAGRALETMPERRRRAPAELAQHFQKGDEIERAFHWTLLAGDEAEAAFVHTEAEARYRLALELAVQRGDPQAEASAREKLAVVWTDLGRPDDAIREVDAAIRLYRQIGDLEGEARAVGQSVRGGLGGPERAAEARRLLEGLRPRLEARGPSSGLARLYFDLGALVGDYVSLEQAIELAARGSEVARAVGDRASLLWCDLLRGMLPLVMGRPGDTESVMHQILDGEDGDTLPLDVRASALESLGAALAFQGQLAAGLRHVERALDLTERVDIPGNIHHTLNVLVMLEFFAGTWEAARGHAERIAAISDRLPREGWWMAMGIMFLGKIALYQGSIEEGERHLLDVVARAYDDCFVWGAAAGLADQELFAGDAEAALRRLESLPRAGPLRDLWHLDVLARVYLALGDAVEAETILTTWIRQCRSGDRAKYIDALWSLGTVQAAGERWAEADASFGEAVALAHEMPYPYAEAQALYHWGLACSRRREDVDARARLEGALRIFQRLGAVPYAERTQRALAALNA